MNGGLRLAGRLGLCDRLGRHSRVRDGRLGTGLVGTTDDLGRRPLDDRLFVASAASFSQDPSSAPLVWVIDSVTGQRGPLTWQDEPTTLNAPEQVSVLFPAPKPIPGESGKRFLPRVVDKRDWTVRPLRVPRTQRRRWRSTSLARAGSGSPPPPRAVRSGSPTPTSRRSLLDRCRTSVLAAPHHRGIGRFSRSPRFRPIVRCCGHRGPRGGDERVGRCDRRLHFRRRRGNLEHGGSGSGLRERERLYALADGRLMVVLSHVNNVANAVGVLVSNSPSDWSQLEASAFGFDPEVLPLLHSSVDVTQHGLVVHHERDSCDNAQLAMPLRFSTDLTDW